jgi:hypothetical protein
MPHVISKTKQLIGRILHRIKNRLPTIAAFGREELKRLYTELPKYTQDELISWIRFKAGSDKPEYFGCKAKGGLELQQVPEEFAAYLMWLKSAHIKSYLEIGIGVGSSFFLSNTFLGNVEKSHAVDNASYGHLKNQLSKIEEKVSTLKELKPKANIKFFNQDSEVFFGNGGETYDFIFIDGDHSYEGVKADYINALKILNKNGYLAFHDIASEYCPGVSQLWQEIKTTGYAQEFVHSTHCGIGILQPQ